MVQHLHSLQMFHSHQMIHCFRSIRFLQNSRWTLTPPVRHLHLNFLMFHLSHLTHLIPTLQRPLMHHMNLSHHLNR